MITINPGANKYDQLFQDAYNVLTDDSVKTILKETYNTDIVLEDYTIANGKITSLEEYFMYIGYLAKIHDYNVKEALKDSALNWNERCATYAKYLMLPIDEDYFKINMNTRTISVPSLFSAHGVGLMGDQRAETLLFEVDRYFDYVDLLRTTIYVQWTTGDADDATLLSLVDYDDKKIRLGWTLSSNATVGNNITFSLRFFIRDSLDATKIIYSLNTLPVSVKIRNALQVNVNNTYTDEEPYLFTEAIKNGADSNTTIFPNPPTFTTLSPIEKTAYLNDENELTFTSFATVTDSGTVSYSWEYRPRNGSASIQLSSAGTNEDYGLTTNIDGVGAHCKITDTDKKITGQYFAVAKNTIKRNEAITTSEAWIVPGPTNITYSTDLSENNNFLGAVYAITTDEIRIADKEYYIQNDNKEYELATAGDSFESDVIYYEKTMEKTLNINAILDTNATSTYQWYKIPTLNGTPEAIDGATASNYTATMPGWYYVKTTSTLNRDTMDKDSSIAKVTNVPSAPVVTYQDTDAEGGLYNVVINFDTLDEDTYRLAVNVAAITNPLLSENIEYKWLCKLSEEDTYNNDVEVGKYGVVGIADNTLTIQYSEPLVFKCEVINHLNGATASTESDTYVIINIPTN